MTLAREVEAAGLRWTVYPLGCMDQFEVECILVRLLGQPLGYALGAVVESVAPPLVEMLREAVARRDGDGPRFDLAALLDMDTADPRLAQVWEALMAGLSEALGNAARGFSAALAVRMDAGDLRRLAEVTLFSSGLTVLGKDGKPARVTSPEVFDGLVRRDPAAKYKVIGAVLAATYSREPEPEAPG